MKIVIVGGNECMACQYKSICEEYKLKAKIFTKMSGTFKDKIGQPEILVLFTNTMSHKMIKCAMSEIKGKNVTVLRSGSSSATALKNLLEDYKAS